MRTKQSRATLDAGRDDETFQLTIDRLNDEGFGVGLQRGKEVWINGAFPGERVTARFGRMVGEASIARLVRVLEPSPDRLSAGPSCSPGCAGCSLLRLSYTAQLRFKQERVIQALRRVNIAQSMAILPVRPADPALGYRTIAKLSVSFTGRRPAVGLFSWGTRSVPSTTTCPTHHPLVNAIAEAVSLELERLVKKGASATQLDWLKHVVVRISPVFSKAMVTFVVSKPDRALDQVSKGLQRRIPEIVSLHLNLKRRPGPNVFGPETSKLWGFPDLLDQVGERRVLLSPTSFFQAHHGQAAWIYDLVREWAALSRQDSALDVYCGVGGISMSLAKDAGRVLGVEASEAAVADARRNAELNKLTNCRYQAADAARLTEVIRLRERPVAVTLNPPRAGAGEQALRQIAALRPARLVYVSCSPDSLAADTRALAALGFTPREAQPVDMFPQTPHIETVVRFESVG